ncbi:hypothetical protein [Lacicoccus qingdaonensis]|uniref:Lipoprotein n=1 Tax=Lacicoccus qingdaonensis TaxID=576118 RepID=A0A1G9B9W1_9BACL|nr:hypothetical protein [Salinicoccus qingdaonensis]SDK35820.1 hypothetical protein SAMN05216216_102159 [Salinicoccus qingdaonensis]
MKQVSVLLMTLFLAGCGFSGIMPEKYDGEALEINEEAAELYEQDNKLLHAGMEDRFHFLNATVESTADETGEAVTISSGSYEIGEDIEEGRYRIGGGDTSAGALVTYDPEGTRLIEIAMGIFTSDLILNLSDGMQLDYKSRDAEIELVPAEEEMMNAARNESFIIPAGIHEVGRHLETGEYSLVTDYLPVQRADGEKDVYANYSSVSSFIVNEPLLEEEMMDIEELLVTLNEGDMIITEYPITIRKE